MRLVAYHENVGPVRYTFDVDEGEGVIKSVLEVLEEYAFPDKQEYKVVASADLDTNEVHFAYLEASSHRQSLSNWLPQLTLSFIEIHEIGLEELRHKLRLLERPY